MPRGLGLAAEEPGVGLGACLAGISGADPGQWFTNKPADTKVKIGHHWAPVWSLASKDATVYIGESAGCWLWLLAWPDVAWSVIHDGLRLTDLRSAGPQVDIPAGAVSARLMC